VAGRRETFCPRASCFFKRNGVINSLIQIRGHLANVRIAVKGLRPVSVEVSFEFYLYLYCDISAEIEIAC
jgi:hypothetical protein